MICFISKNKEGRRKDHFCMCSLKHSRLKISPVPRPFSFSFFALEIAFPICKDQSSLEKWLYLGLDRKNIRCYERIPSYQKIRKLWNTTGVVSEDLGPSFTPLLAQNGTIRISMRIVTAINSQAYNVDKYADKIGKGC